jgi:hypothetical protein
VALGEGLSSTELFIESIIWLLGHLVNTEQETLINDLMKHGIIS